MQPVYVIDAAESVPHTYIAELERRLADVQRWYRAATGGVTFHAAPVVVQRERLATAPVDVSSSGSWWTLLMERGKRYGYDWSDPDVTMLWVVPSSGDIATGNSANGRMTLPVAGADERRGELGGMALVGAEGLVRVTRGDCPERGMMQQEWWCSGSSFSGIVAHELGHTWGLPHPADVGVRLRCAADSVSTLMQCQWKFPADSLLTYEREHLRTLGRWFSSSGGEPVVPLRAGDLRIAVGTVDDLPADSLIWLGGRGAGSGYQWALRISGRATAGRPTDARWLEFDVGFLQGTGHRATLTVLLDGHLAYERRLRDGDPPLSVRLRLRGARRVEIRGGPAIVMGHPRWRR